MSVYMQNHDKILDTITALCAAHPYGPTMDEIAAASRVAKSVVFNHVKDLAREGYITYTPGIARSISRSKR